MRSLGGRIRVRIKRPWRGYAAGAVIKPPAAMRQVLLASEIAEPVAEEVPALERPALDLGAPDPEPERKRRRKKDAE